MTEAIAGCSQQETDVVVTALSQTQIAVMNAYNDLRSWRELGTKLNMAHTVLYSIGRAYWSHVSWDTIRLVRQRLGLSDPGPVIYTLAPNATVLDEMQQLRFEIIELRAERDAAREANVCILHDATTEVAQLRKRRTNKPDSHPSCFRPRLSLDPEKRLERLGHLWQEAYMELASRRNK
jgi:hypothetical protein